MLHSKVLPGPPGMKFVFQMTEAEKAVYEEDSFKRCYPTYRRICEFREAAP